MFRQLAGDRSAVGARSNSSTDNASAHIVRIAWGPERKVERLYRAAFVFRRLCNHYVQAFNEN
jgi:hypothetical protein